MPKSPTVTAALIFQVANDLHSEGKTVTAEAVRSELRARTGVGGSFNTIVPILANWRIAQREDSGALPSRPSELGIAVERFAGEIWRVAVAKASEKFALEHENQAGRDADLLRISDVSAELQEQLDRAVAEIDELKKTNQVLVSQVDDWRKRFVALEVDRAAMKQALEESRAGLVLAREQAAELRGEIKYLRGGGNA